MISAKNVAASELGIYIALFWCFLVIMRYLCLSQGGRQQQAENMAENTTKTKIEDTTDNYNSSEDGVVPLKKAKRFRSAFTTEQIQYLDAEFRKYPYIGSARRKEVASALNIPERAVKIWFQNRRMKEKKDVTTNTECDEHKHSRKIDGANDQLNNECTVTSTNNRHYASLPLMSPKNENPKHIDVTIKKENETIARNDDKQVQRGNTNQSSTEFSTELYKKYNIHFGDQEFSPPQQPFIDEIASKPALYSPKNEVSSTSPHEKLPQDLSRKRKPQIKPIRAPQNPTGGYFPLNLKKYYAEPSLPVGSNMLWKPVQMLPIVPTGTSVAPAPTPASKKECHCECRCHPAPVLLQQAASNPVAQYVLTALPLPNPYYKY